MQLCRGSHTNTLVEDPTDKANIYIYSVGQRGVSVIERARGMLGNRGCRRPECTAILDRSDQSPLAHPEQAKVVSTPRILNQLAPVTYHAPLPEDQARRAAAMAARAAAAAANGAPAAPAGPPHTAITPVVMYCHDITVFQAIGKAGAACIGYGLLLDIRTRRIRSGSRRRLTRISRLAFGHVQQRREEKCMFGDEWSGPHCRATDNKDWGGLSIYRLANGSMQFKNYYKIPAGLAATAGCTAHNGSLIPVPGRDIAIYSWYQGGLSVVDWTDPSHPKEIAFYALGPDDSTKVTMGGLLVNVLV